MTRRVRPMRGMFVAVLAAVLVAGPWRSALASGSSTRSALEATGSVIGVSQISKDNLPRVVPFERDTQAGAAVAIDPADPNRIVAAFPQQMFPGPYYPWGSAAIGFATSHDAGGTWTTGLLPGLTEASGGTMARATSPSVAFGRGDTVFVASLVFAGGFGPTGIMVSRSDDGGLSWHEPIRAWTDDAFNAWSGQPAIAADANPSSPFFGRVYVAWDRLWDAGDELFLRYSNDLGDTWKPLNFLPADGYNVRATVQPNGKMTIVYYDAYFTGNIRSLTSSNGGHSFSNVTVGGFHPTEPGDQQTGEEPDVTTDPETGHLYAVWQDSSLRSDGLSDILVFRSTNGGSSWQGPVKANLDDPETQATHFTPAVAAYGGIVHVTYLSREFTPGVGYASHVTLQYARSIDDGQTFDAPLDVGPRTNIAYAAHLGSDWFLGDYMGLAADPAGAWAVWSRASAPSHPHPYHQTTWAARIEG